MKFYVECYPVYLKVRRPFKTFYTNSVSISYFYKHVYTTTYRLLFELL